jgi:hypothetical protein
MRPVWVKDANKIYKPPRDWMEERDGKCGDLYVRRFQPDGAGPAYHYSAWKPSADELQALIDGGVVELLIIGVQPAVALNVVEETLDPRSAVPSSDSDQRRDLPSGIDAVLADETKT